jgi:hypothetical protein
MCKETSHEGHQGSLLIFLIFGGRCTGCKRMKDCRTGGRGERAVGGRAREKGQAEAKNKTKKFQLCLSLTGLLCEKNGPNLSKIVLILVRRRYIV